MPLADLKTVDWERKVVLIQYAKGLIRQYAVPILEDQTVYGTDALTRIAYIDTQDIARMTFTALGNEKTNRGFDIC